MKSTHEEETEKMTLTGCLIFLLIFLVPLVIQLIETLFIVAIFAVIIGGIYYGIQYLIRFEEEYGHLKKLSSDMPDHMNKVKQLFNRVFEKKAALPEANPYEDVLEQIQQMDGKIQDLKDTRKEEVKITIQQYGKELEKKNKSTLLKGFFGEPEDAELSPSDEFEKQEFQREVQKKEESLELRIIKQDLAEELFDQKKEILAVREEAKEERMKLWVDMVTGFNLMGDKLLQLGKEVMSVKEYTIQKFALVETNFTKQIADMKIQFGKEVTDMKIQFGKEVVRLDQQQLKVVRKLQEYEHILKMYTADMIAIKNEAETSFLRGKALLDEVKLAHERHKVKMESASNNLQTGLMQMALRNAGFANEVGAAKLLIDKKAQEITFALKDMGYERMGINMLREEHANRVDVEEQKLQVMAEKQKQLSEEIKMEQKRGREVAHLEHKLFMAKGEEQYTRQRANLIRQEAAMVKRMTR